MKIVFDDEMKDYISRMLNADIEEIYLDSDSMEIKTDFVRFIMDLINARTWSLVKNPYIYDANNKTLTILDNDPQFEADLLFKVEMLLNKFKEDSDD